VQQKQTQVQLHTANPCHSDRWHVGNCK